VKSATVYLGFLNLVLDMQWVTHKNSLASSKFLRFFLLDRTHLYLDRPRSSIPGTIGQLTPPPSHNAFLQTLPLLYRKLIYTFWTALGRRAAQLAYRPITHAFRADIITAPSEIMLVYIWTVLDCRRGSPTDSTPGQDVFLVDIVAVPHKTPLASGANVCAKSGR